MTVTAEDALRSTAVRDRSPEQDRAAVRDAEPVWSPVTRFALSGLSADASEGFDLWGVARLAGDAWTVVAATATLEQAVGIQLDWSETICRAVQRSPEAVLVGDLRRRRDPVLRAASERWDVRGYVGAPLHAPDGTQVGSVCGWSRTPAHDDERMRARVTRNAEFLQHELAREVDRVADDRRRDWSADAETRDALTHLADRRAWGRLLQREDERGRGLAEPAAVTVVDVADVGSTRAFRRVARSLREAVGDDGAVARLGARQFGVLTAGPSGRGAGAGADRVIEAVAEVAPRARAGRARRLGTGALADAWAAAEADLLAARRSGGQVGGLVSGPAGSPSDRPR